nr:40S ribosomal protein S11 [Paratrimastix eleionoma]
MAASVNSALKALETEQTERAFQQQAPIFVGRLRALGKKVTRKDVRYWRNIGLGFKTPKEAVDGSYIDKKCPFTGNVSIRGHIFRGFVHSYKMKRTLIVRRDYLHYISKYNRYEKRHHNIAAHVSPCFKDVKEGDQVIIGQCRPLSKTVRFNVVKVIPRGSGDKKKFQKF